MLRLFAGYEERESAGFHVFMSSVLRLTSMPFQLFPMNDLEQLDGSNAFTYARFRIPSLCEYRGWALFCDASDMLALGDLRELWALRDDRFAVQVVKRPNYRTRHPIKYVGTSMECPNIDYARKNWASVMLMNCEAPEWRALDLSAKSRELLQFKGIEDSRIGDLPPQWNVLVDEGDLDDGAKILHWTAGIPAFPNYKQAPRASDWWREYDAMTGW